MRFLYAAFALAAIVALSGCSMKNPMNVKEFRDAFEKGHFLAKKKVVNVKRPYSKVYADLGAYATRCLNYKQTTTVRERYGTTTSVTYFSAYTEQTAQGKGYLALQSHSVAPNLVKTSPEPEGGYYIFLTDIKSKGGQTEITLYGAKIFYGDYFKAIEAVSKGEKNKFCPGEG